MYSEMIWFAMSYAVQHRRENDVKSKLPSVGFCRNGKLCHCEILPNFS